MKAGHSNLFKLILVLGLLFGLHTTASAQRIRVITTVPDLADMTKQIGKELVEVESLTRLDADPSHLRDDRLIGDVRRVQLEQFGRIRKVFVPAHGVDLRLWRSLHVDTSIDGLLDGLGGLPPSR